MDPDRRRGKQGGRESTAKVLEAMRKAREEGLRPSAMMEIEEPEYVELAGEELDEYEEYAKDIQADRDDEESEERERAKQRATARGEKPKQAKAAPEVAIAVPKVFLSKPVRSSAQQAPAVVKSASSMIKDHPEFFSTADSLIGQLDDELDEQPPAPAPPVPPPPPPPPPQPEVPSDAQPGSTSRSALASVAGTGIWNSGMPGGIKHLREDPLPRAGSSGPRPAPSASPAAPLAATSADAPATGPAAPVGPPPKQPRTSSPDDDEDDGEKSGASRSQEAPKAAASGDGAKGATPAAPAAGAKETKPAATPQARGCCRNSFWRGRPGPNPPRLPPRRPDRPAAGVPGSPSRGGTLRLKAAP
ncbi:hypothetical protein PAPYR_8688 [Paratrimastix pyriformis]|uniref:Uncharacterized protein n=1 Tax=Paratrimastix pyriformis TaxID=342808 RepID=A0ABQ8UA25_9EUKA|nr:hypothetical protein PAPYR_8688 [Paratrimastix pyriformis]